jgi:lysophospholipase L1-like esterase
MGAAIVALAGCGGPAVAPPSGGFLAFGDSITQQAFSSPSAWTGPALAFVGLPGYTSAEAASQLDGALSAHAEATTVGLAFGTNDALRGNTPGAFKTMMRVMATKVKAAGKAPRFARLPYGTASGLASVPSFNAAIAELDTELGLASGPDLYGYFQAHPDQLGSDGIHPTDAGRVAIQRLWSDAVR